MTRIGTTTMIMVVSKTMTMTMVATMTKNMTITMTKIFKQVQNDNFYWLLRIIKVYKNSICTSSLNIDVFFITQPTKFISSTCTGSQKISS